MGQVYVRGMGRVSGYGILFFYVCDMYETMRLDDMPIYPTN